MFYDSTNKMKAFTLSYDDGVFQDVRFVEMLNRYGLKCTFNLNSGIMSRDSCWENGGKHIRRLDRSEIGSLYDGHEISAHGLTHPHPLELDDNALRYEISEDIARLEQQFGKKPIGFAYPYGEYDDKLCRILEENGIKYARTVNSTCNFEPQKDLIRFNPTCHHNDPQLMELARRFVEAKPDKPQIFYLWGHSYEFDVDNTWEMFEEFCRYISGRADIFYGTNAEVLL